MPGSLTHPCTKTTLTVLHIITNTINSFRKKALYISILIDHYKPWTLIYNFFESSVLTFPFF